MVITIDDVGGSLLLKARKWPVYRVDLCDCDGLLASGRSCQQRIMPSRLQRGGSTACCSFCVEGNLVTSREAIAKEDIKRGHRRAVSTWVENAVLVDWTVDSEIKGARPLRTIRS